MGNKVFVIVSHVASAPFVHGQHVQGPCYVVDGKTYAFVSSTNEPGIEKELSEHIAQNLPMILYDGTSFRFVVSATIGKRGRLKQLSLVNKKSFKGNMWVWKDVKKMLNAVQFKPASYGGKPISYSFVFHIKVDFTTWR